jgi:hypothetical protein
MQGFVGSQPAQENDRDMSDTASAEWRLVLTAPGVGLYIHLPLSQVQEVCMRLDRAWLSYSVDPQAISIEGGPEITTIHFSPDVDAARIFAALNELD